MAPTFSMELMVTPAAQDTTMCLSSMLAPISSRMKGMMCGFTARKSTSLWCTVSLLWEVRFTPIFYRNARGLSLPHGPSTHKAKSPEPREAQRLLGCGASWVGGQNPLSCPYPDMEKALGSGMFPFEAKKPSKPQLSPSYLRL